MATPTPSSRLMVLMFTDIVRSVDLKTRLGNTEAVQLIAQHDAIFKDIMKQAAGAEILKDTGDGFLARFGSASEAVLTALKFQYALHLLGAGRAERQIRVRLGIHLGEVSELEAETATGIAKISGIAVDLTARLMGLALPDQILLTGAAFDNARQYVREHPPVDLRGTSPDIKWMAHGPYVFQGSDDPMEVFEVGAVGVAPLLNPPDSEKAHRALGEGDEETLGWRPASGLEVPGRLGWILDRRVGEGGFGEVWLGRNQRTGSLRVFKFCHDAERLRSFKRELTLIRLLRETLGERRDIARLYEVRLDEPPFYLETEYTDQGSLNEWALKVGGIDTVPLETRLDLVARIADAVAAAHSVGVLHKDIKPDNILIYLNEDHHPMPRLADFGIGMITDQRKLREAELSDTAFVSMSEEEEAQMTGSPIYTPPEALAGHRFTMQGDIYALGVLLYQMVVGDLSRPLASGWERDVADPLLRADVADCVVGQEERRLSSAKELADRLRTLPQRRRAALRKRITRTSAVAASVLLVVVGLFFLYERGLRQVAEVERDRVLRLNDFLVDWVMKQSDPAGETIVPAHEVTIASSLIGAMKSAESILGDDPELMAEALQTIGTSLKNLGLWTDAETAHRKALLVRRELFTGDHPKVAESLRDVADTLWWQGRFDEALPLFEQSLAMRERLFDASSAEVAEGMNGLAACLNRVDRSAEAEDLYRKALAIRKALYETDPQSIDPLLIAASQNNLATCLRGREKFEEAKALFEEAIDTAISVRGADHFYVARALHNVGENFRRMNDLPGAEAKLREALAMKHRVLSADHPSIGETEYALSEVLVLQEKLDEALDHARACLDIWSAALSDDHFDIARAHQRVGEILLRLGEHEDAETHLLSAFDRSVAIRGRSDPATAQIAAELIALYTAMNQPDKAAEYRAALAADGRGVVEDP